MTYRERKEARLEKRRDWAESRDLKAAQAFNTARTIADGIPMGQPVLIGHHSERHHRRDIARIDANMRKGCESEQMASEHRSKAGGIAHQLDTSIYSDDPDAIEALQSRVTELEATRDRMKRVNTLYRKNDVAGLAAMGLNLDTLKARVAAIGYSWVKAPYEAYQLSNLGARITAAKKRITDVQDRQRRAAAAEEAGGVAVQYSTDGVYCRLTFADKPERSTLDALKAAGFHWGAGSWGGTTRNLPADIAHEVATV